LLVIFLPSRVWAQQVTVLRGGTLIDGTGASPQADTIIVIEDNRISSIGSDDIPVGASIIDVTGKYIVPGLWDKHLHYKDWFPELLATYGITSAFVQADQAMPWLHVQEEGIAKGKIPGPRMFFRERSFNVFGSVAEAAAELDAARTDYQRLRREQAPHGPLRTAECTVFGAEERLAMARAQEAGDTLALQHEYSPAEVQVLDHVHPAGIHPRLRGAARARRGPRARRP